MDSFEFNKLIGALLGTVFIVFTIGLLSDGIFASPHPEKPGYGIEAPDEEASNAGGAPVAEEKPIAVLLASADATAGAAVFKKCQACHSGEKGGPNKVGPDLWAIVDRPVAAHEGFAYSAAMKEFAKGGSELWTYDNLNHFLTSPKALVKGTAMGFAGLKKPEERAKMCIRDSHQGRAVAARIGADHAGIDRVDVAAVAADPHLLDGLAHGGGKRRHQLFLLLDHVQRGAPRRARAQPRHLGQELDQPFDFRTDDSLGHGIEGWEGNKSE